LIGSVFVDIDNPEIIINGGEIYNSWTAKSRYLNVGKSLSEFPPNTSIEVSRLTGRGVLIPVKVFHEIGLYDDKHFKQCGDMELPSRARNHGYKLLISYSSIILSHIKATAKINIINNGYRLRDIGMVFFGIKSNNNIKYVFYNCRTVSKSFLQLMVVFMFSFGRRFGRFILRVRSL
jgi:GT2 family glycosyltransferase